MTSFLTFTVLQRPKMSVIVISLFLNELSSNLEQEVKIGSLFTFIAQKLLFFIIYYKRDYFYLVFGHFFSQTRVRNRVTMATA